MADTDQHKDQDLFENSPEANLRGQRLVHNGTHDPGEIIQNHKGQQCVKQAIAAAEEVAEPAAHGGEYDLNGIPKFFHDNKSSFIRR